MNTITGITSNGLDAADIRLTDSATYSQWGVRSLIIGAHQLVIVASNAKACREASRALSALAKAADELSSWALEQADAADDREAALTPAREAS